MKILGNTSRRIVVAVLALSGFAVVPSVAQTTDEAVRAAVTSGSSARVIMQFATTAERDAAFDRLLDRGAAVRVTDTEAGPALVVLGSAAAFGDEVAVASQTSLDAKVVDRQGQPIPVGGTPIRVHGGVGVPCNAPSSICVGSLNTIEGDSNYDNVAFSSSAGPTRFDLLAKPDLVAPGVKIVSLAAPGSRLFRDYPELEPADASGYFMLSGTSMASPAVAAAAALIFEANKNLSANALKMSLQFTSRLLVDADGDAKVDVLTQGAGALNLGGAMTLASSIRPYSVFGAPWLRRSLVASNRDATGRTINWSRRIIYGDRFMNPRYAQIHLVRWEDDIVWGYDTIDDNIVWGNNDNIVWGNNEDDNIVWGNDEADNIVWGNDVDDNIVWGHGDNIVWGIEDDNIVWGNGKVRGRWAASLTSSFWDDNIVWGNVTRLNEDNIVWGNDDDNIVWGNAVLTSPGGGR